MAKRLATRDGICSTEAGHYERHPPRTLTRAGRIHDEPCCENVCPDPVNLHRIWRETINRLESLGRAVQESKRLDEALHFAQFVFWSGLCELCDAFPSPAPLKVDGAFLRWKCRELQSQVQERFRLNDSEPHIESTALEAINRKLDMIAGHVSKFSPPVDGRAGCGDTADPGLRLLPGGAESTNVEAA